VGGVTGRLVIQHSADPAVAGVSRYWQMETQLRLAESRTGSVVGATGAIYAIRRRLFEPLPQAVILDDVYLPLRIVRKGYRIAMAPRAVAFDRPSGNAAMEYRRRVRTMVGNYELIRLMPELLIPWRNPIFARYVSHKVLRILTPAFCVGSMVSAFMVGGTYTLFGLAMALMYILGALGMLIPVRALSIPSGFVLLHSAAVSALIRPFRSGAQVWAPQTR
jgi:cellulose synthase/poly-beta-1,6-N-acetylglucosamine synthase-like glycosyltransferase